MLDDHWRQSAFILEPLMLTTQPEAKASAHVCALSSSADQP